MAEKLPRRQAKETSTSSWLKTRSKKNADKDGARKAKARQEASSLEGQGRCQIDLKNTYVLAKKQADVKKAGWYKFGWQVRRSKKLQVM